MPRLGRLEARSLGLEGHEKKSNIQTVDEVRGPPAWGTIICIIRVDELRFRSDDVLIA